MLVVASLALALQVTVRVGPQERSDSARRARRDSIRTVINERIRDRENRAPRRQPVTPELERSAFLDAAARDLLTRARVARMRQDSSLLSYDATTYQRISVGLGFRAIGRERLLFRRENAARVQWTRDGGAWVELKGRRSVTPSFGKDNHMDLDDPDFDDFSPLPYYPGRESLWFGSGTARAEVDERELVHPLAIGSEAYYRYASGDSISFTLPDKKVIRLQELRVEPRRPEWRLSVGSFWFDVATGQLVRAVYRLAVPMDIWAIAEEENKRAKTDTGRANASDLRDVDEDVPKWIKGIMSPLAANLEAVTIEYGLFGTRFWLPRTQYAEGWAKAGFMRIPFKIEESFKYASVNGTDSIPPVPPRPRSLRDSLFGDSMLLRDLPPEERRRRIRAMVDAAGERTRQQRARRQDECAKTGYYTTDQFYERSVAVAVRIPCDTTKLATAPELPPSIYSSGEELFGESDRLELLKALDFSLQPGWAPQPIVTNYGLAYTRYNRVEGFSTAIAASTQLGRGYSVDGQFRLGTGDWEPYVEANLQRSNGRDIWRLGAYRRLAVANEVESPLSFGAGLGALIFGRDNGFYYRTWGAEFERSSMRGSGLSTRFFGEYASTAEVTTSWNLANALGSAAQFRENFTAEHGTTLGLTIRDTRSFGFDPRSWRALTDLRVEGGWFGPRIDTVEDRWWSRAAADLTVSRGFGDRVSAALTLGAGIADKAPIQRQFFLGGSQTVRGQLPGTEIGETFWLSRFELGGAVRGARPVLFGDLGWTGPRSDWWHPGRPLSGVGVGMSVMDGLIRADLARGIYPRAKWRFDLYVEARF